MRQDTLLVVAGDSKTYQKWVDNWGVRLKNVALSQVKNLTDLEGWEGKVYYTILPGYGSLKNHDKILDALKESEYDAVSRTKIESKLKKISINQEFN